jgi:tetratricopeptide (TPR) repeat protein
VVWTGDAPPAPSAPAGTLAAYPRSAQNAALMEQALAASGRKDYAGAVTLLKQIVGADSKDFIAWTEMGTAQFMQGDKGEAEKSYKRALEEKPAYGVALLNLGRLQFAQKNYETAIETLSRFVAAEAASAEGHRLLGEAYLQSKKGSKAVPELEKAIALDPSGQAEAHLRLASLYNAAGYKNLAAAEYEKFLSKRPDYPDRKKLEDYIRQNKP